MTPECLSKCHTSVALVVVPIRIYHDMMSLQFFPGKEYAAVFLKNFESEVRSICVSAAATDPQYSV